MASNQRTDNPTADAPQPAATPSTDMRSLGDLFNELSQDFSYLIRKEVELARTEMMENLGQARRSIILMAAAGLVGYAGFIVLLVAVADLLYTLTGSFWLAALIVGVAVLIASAILFFAGKSAMSNVNLVPEQTLETLQNDARWAKEQIQ